MVQQERAQVTRDRLVDGAALTFYRLGYGIATTNDIVKEAGATRGAMYFHFQSKEELARAVIAKEHELATEAGARIRAMDRPAFETMVLLCIDLAERLMTDPVVKAGIRLTTEVTNFDPPLRAPYEDWLQMFAAIAVEAISEGDFRDTVDPDVFARFLIPAYTGIQLVSDTFTGRADLPQRIREMWLFVVPSVVPVDRLGAAWALLDRLIPASESFAVTARP
jgi:AcrR family transcriptional regulator